MFYLIVCDSPGYSIKHVFNSSPPRPVDFISSAGGLRGDGRVPRGRGEQRYIEGEMRTRAAVALHHTPDVVTAFNSDVDPSPEGKHRRETRADLLLSLFTVWGFSSSSSSCHPSPHLLLSRLLVMRSHETEKLYQLSALPLCLSAPPMLTENG